MISWDGSSPATQIIELRYQSCGTGSLPVPSSPLQLRRLHPSIRLHRPPHLGLSNTLTAKTPLSKTWATTHLSHPPALTQIRNPPVHPTMVLWSRVYLPSMTSTTTTTSFRKMRSHRRRSRRCMIQRNLKLCFHMSRSLFPNILDLPWSLASLVYPANLAPCKSLCRLVHPPSLPSRTSGK